MSAALPRILAEVHLSRPAEGAPEPTVQQRVVLERAALGAPRRWVAERRGTILVLRDEAADRTFRRVYGTLGDGARAFRHFLAARAAEGFFEVGRRHFEAPPLGAPVPGPGGLAFRRASTPLRRVTDWMPPSLTAVRRRLMEPLRIEGPGLSSLWLEGGPGGVTAHLGRRDTLTRLPLPKVPPTRVHVARLAHRPDEGAFLVGWGDRLVEIDLPSRSVRPFGRTTHLSLPRWLAYEEKGRSALGVRGTRLVRLDGAGERTLLDAPGPVTGLRRLRDGQWAMATPSALWLLEVREQGARIVQRLPLESSTGLGTWGGGEWLVLFGAVTHRAGRAHVFGNVAGELGSALTVNERWTDAYEARGASWMVREGTDGAPTLHRVEGLERLTSVAPPVAHVVHSAISELPPAGGDALDAEELEVEGEVGGPSLAPATLLPGALAEELEGSEAPPPPTGTRPYLPNSQEPGPPPRLEVRLVQQLDAEPPEERLDDIWDRETSGDLVLDEQALRDGVRAREVGHDSPPPVGSPGARDPGAEWRACSPLEAALADDDPAAVDAHLAAGADPDTPFGDGARPLHRARSVTCLARLLDAGAAVRGAKAASSEGTPPLVAQARLDAPSRAPRLALLLERGATPRVRDRRGRGPLHEAAAAADLEATELLLAAGAPVNGPRKGTSALHEAARVGAGEVVEALLIAGAAVEPADESGRRPLHLAARHGHLDVVELLVEAGARVDRGAGDLGVEGRRTALHEAADGTHGAVVHRLLRAGARADLATSTGRLPSDLAIGDPALFFLLEDVQRHGPGAADVRSERERAAARAEDGEALWVARGPVPSALRLAGDLQGVLRTSDRAVPGPSGDAVVLRPASAGRSWVWLGRPDGTLLSLEVAASNRTLAARAPDRWVLSDGAEITAVDPSTGLGECLAGPGTLGGPVTALGAASESLVLAEVGGHLVLLDGSREVTRIDGAGLGRWMGTGTPLVLLEPLLDPQVTLLASATPDGLRRVGRLPVAVEEVVTTREAGDLVVRARARHGVELTGVHGLRVHHPEAAGGELVLGLPATADELAGWPTVPFVR